MRSYVPLAGLVALAAAFATGCALSHEATIDTGTDFDGSVDAPRPDGFAGEVVARPDVVTARDGGCPAGLMSCGAATECVDLSSDPSNCGSCGHACPTPSGGSAVCSAGTCSANCAMGYHVCGTACVPETSTTQCGPSCMPCMPVQHATVACVGGACTQTCVPGFVDNGGACVPPIPTTCGDRMLQPPETCDDGNHVAGDGCSPGCQMEPGTSAEDCSSGITSIRITDSGTHVYAGTTTGAANDNSGNGTCSARGPDVAYQIIYSLPASFYTYTVTATPSSHWDLVLQHGAACPPASCVDMYYAGTAESYSFSPTGPATTYEMVDGYGPTDDGDFVLQIDVL